MFDPDSVAFEIGKHGRICTIWHCDPCTDGTDSSCGIFMRARHGDPEVLARIANRFDTEWGMKPTQGFGGWFNEDGSQRLSTSGIVLDMFWHAAHEVFKKNWKKTDKWLRNNIVEILQFAENNVDSLHSGFGYFTKYPKDYTRRERIEQHAGIVYAFILRDLRPWWKHPKWHVHHWQVTFPFLGTRCRALLAALKGTPHA